MLVAPRNHYKLLGDMGVQAGQEVRSYFPSAHLDVFKKKNKKTEASSADPFSWFDAQMGKWLPILSRVVTKTVFGDDPDRHWNVVQNNGMSCPCFSSIFGNEYGLFRRCMLLCI